MNIDYYMNDFDEDNGVIPNVLPMIIPDDDAMPDYSLNSKMLNKSLPVLPLRDKMCIRDRLWFVIADHATIGGNAHLTISKGVEGINRFVGRSARR